MKKLALLFLYGLSLVFIAKEGLIAIEETKAIYIDVIIPQQDLENVADWC